MKKLSQKKQLEKIKKKYGERFAKMCRARFSTILDEEGKLYEILESLFANNSDNLFEDIQDSNVEDSFVDLI